MERTELMLGEGVNRLWSGRLSPHRPDGDSCRMTDDRGLWKGNAQMRFATFPTINSVISNASDLRQQSHDLVVLPKENRSPMTGRDRASELPNLNECFYEHQGGQPRTPQA
jgi:hypothetical protein